MMAASRLGLERQGGDPGSPKGSSCYASDPWTPTIRSGQQGPSLILAGSRLACNIGGAL